MILIRFTAASSYQFTWTFELNVSRFHRTNYWSCDTSRQKGTIIGYCSTRLLGYWCCIILFRVNVRWLRSACMVAILGVCHNKNAWGDKINIYTTLRRFLCILRSYFRRHLPKHFWITIGRIHSVLLSTFVSSLLIACFRFLSRHFIFTHGTCEVRREKC